VSVVANVAVNLDARGVTAQLAAIRQGSIGAADGFKNLQSRAQAVKSIVEAQQGSFAKASTVQGVFAAKVKNTEFAIKAQIAALRDVQSKVQFNGALYQKAGQQIKQYEAVLRSANREEEKGIGIKGRLGSALGGLRGALVSIGAGLAVRKAFVDASELESAQARIGLLTKNFSQLTGIQEVAANAAKKFNLSQAESLGTLTDLGNRIGPTGASLQDVANVYEGFNTLLALNKVNTAGAASSTLALNQALGSGQLAGEEFNAISEATPQLLDAVAKVMGRTRAELKQLASDGKISSQVLIEALTRIRTEGAEDLKTAFAGAFGATRRFNAALEDFSATIGTELLPALTPLISSATEILRLFGRLPGPVKTLIAAAAGLTAAFVALAPAISATIGLLGGLSLATLAAAGPWIALAAGVTAAAVALAGYRSESQKVGGAARGGDASNVAAASKLLAQKDAQIAGLQGQRQTASGRQRGSIDRNLAVLRRERAQLQSDVKAGTAATPAATAANAMGTPVGATVGGASTGRGGGASKAADEAKRLAEELQRSVERGNDLFRQFSRQAVLLGTTSETERKRLQIQYEYQDRVREINELKDAEQKVNLMAVNDEIRRLQTLELQTEELKKQLEVFYELAGLSMGGMLPGGAGAFRTDVNLDPNDRAQQKIDEYKTKLTELQDPINMAQRGAQGIGDAFSSSFQGIITGTQTAQEALASFFQNIAKSFLDMATEIIAQMVIMYAFKQLLGLFGGGAGIAPSNNFSGAFSGTTASFNPSSFGMGLLPGRAAGGPVSSGQTYMVGERGPELFVPGRSGTIVANDKMGGGNTNVVVNVDAKGSSVEGDEQGANQLGRVISAAVQSELIKQQRPGGILAR
jgi:tape measure domain-containing protein